MEHNDFERRGKHTKDLRLYIHVPFCVKKCSYCDFLSGLSDKEGINSYFESLYKEIRSYSDRTGEYTVSSIFIGGGTPSCVPSEYIVRTLNELKDIFEFSSDKKLEITIEVNPGTIDARKLKDYKNAAINRISFGLQSIHDNELKLLGRIHTYLEFEKNYRLARDLGFNNINIDLMSALPGQTLESWEETLLRIVKLNPEHISAYSLIIEEGTPFYDKYGPEGQDRDHLPTEDVDRLIYSRTKEILQSHGFERYEISNYAKDGFECRHNIAYWRGVSYLGLGLGAASLIENTRFSNLSSLSEYVNSINSIHNNIMYSDMRDKSYYSLLTDLFGIRRDITPLTKDNQMEEFMFLGLRMTEGVSKTEFFKRFLITIDDIYNDKLVKLEKEGLLNINKDRVFLTDYGIDVSNIALSEFVFD